MFKLDISDDVQFPVKLEIPSSGGQVRQFAFTLTARRMTQAELDAAGAIEQPVHEILQDRVTGWHGQRLVLAADGKPAEFSSDAFAAMLGVVNAAPMIFRDYLLACGPKGKAKN